MTARIYCYVFVTEILPLIKLIDCENFGPFNQPMTCIPDMTLLSLVQLKS